MEIKPQDVVEYLMNFIESKGLKANKEHFYPLNNLPLQNILSIPTPCFLFTLNLFTDSILTVYQRRQATGNGEIGLLERDIEEAIKETGKQLKHVEKNIIPEDIKKVIIADCPFCL